jgi:hypothetical protein
MELSIREIEGYRLLEGVPGQPAIQQVADLREVLELCFEHSAHSLLLYPENLTEQFFDLSSGEAGEILQKLRNYHIRLAVVRTPALQMSRRFVELMVDEDQGLDFRLFDQHELAQEWLCRE